MDILGLSIGVVALVVSLYAAVHARRSASAAERSARAADRSAQVAEDALTMEREERRESWIRQIAATLPDGRRVTGLLADLPSSLRQDWRQLVTSAARRNPRTPDEHLRTLLEKYREEWEAAAQSTPLTREATKR